MDHAFTVCFRTENENQSCFSPFGLHETSVLVELILGHLCNHLTDVPLQPNSHIPVVQQSLLPTAQTIQKTKEIPQLQCIDKVVDNPVA